MLVLYPMDLAGLSDIIEMEVLGVYSMRICNGDADIYIVTPHCCIEVPHRDPFLSLCVYNPRRVCREHLQSHSELAIRPHGSISKCRSLCKA